MSGLGEWIAIGQSVPHPTEISLLVALNHGLRVLPPAERHQVLQRHVLQFGRELPAEAVKASIAKVTEPGVVHRFAAPSRDAVRRISHRTNAPRVFVGGPLYVSGAGIMNELVVMLLIGGLSGLAIGVKKWRGEKDARLDCPLTQLYFRRPIEIPTIKDVRD